MKVGVAPDRETKETPTLARTIRLGPQARSGTHPRTAPAADVPLARPLGPTTSSPHVPPATKVCENRASEVQRVVARDAAEVAAGHRAAQLVGADHVDLRGGRTIGGITHLDKRSPESAVPPPGLPGT